MDWPIPLAADTRMVPGWSVLDDEAKLLDTPFPQYLRWLKSPAGQWWMPRLRAKWRILAVVREREQDEHSDTAQDVRWKAEGWHGGRTAPAGQVKRLA